MLDLSSSSDEDAPPLDCGKLRAVLPGAWGGWAGDTPRGSAAPLAPAGNGGSAAPTPACHRAPLAVFTPAAAAAPAAAMDPATNAATAEGWRGPRHLYHPHHDHAEGSRHVGAAVPPPPAGRTFPASAAYCASPLPDEVPVVEDEDCALMMVVLLGEDGDVGGRQWGDMPLECHRDAGEGEARFCPRRGILKVLF